MIRYGRMKDVGGMSVWEFGFGKGRHLSVPVRVFIASDLSGPSVKLFETGGCEVKFPLVGWRLEQVRDGVLVAKRDVVMMVGFYDVESGYRGTGVVDIVSPSGLWSVKYPIYRSELGSLGIGQGVLFNAPVDAEVVVRWQRTGRLYGNPPSGLVGIRKDGVAWKVAGISDLAELEALRKP
jgi:hypothetical protein